MKKFDIKFHGIDDFDRSVYKVVGRDIYFGSTKTILPDRNKFPNNTVKEINHYFQNNQPEIELFGEEFNCEPLGGNSPLWEFTIVED